MAGAEIARPPVHRITLAQLAAPCSALPFADGSMEVRAYSVLWAA